MVNLLQTVDRAQRIAERDLRACMTNDGIVAGAHHFVDVWARDSLFASFGCLHNKDYPALRATIETFINHRRSDGLIPYRILRSSTNFLKYFGRPTYLDSPKADFRSHQSGGLVLDGGLMTVIATAEYVRRSGDKRFYRKYGTQLHDAMDWYEKHYANDLLSEWFQCEWADSVLKFGNVLYTNILYWRALGDMGEHAKQKIIGKRINEKFWNGSYFADWIDYKRQDFFAIHPNMLAIIFGLATDEQSDSILSFATKHCWNGWTVEENYPRYPWWRIPNGK